MVRVCVFCVCVCVCVYVHYLGWGRGIRYHHGYAGKRSQHQLAAGVEGGGCGL